MYNPRDLPHLTPTQRRNVALLCAAMELYASSVEKNWDQELIDEFRSDLRLF